MEKDPNLDLVAFASENGLIVGRMDHHTPVLHVNAVSYLGLCSASDLARRLGRVEEAESWRRAGESLQNAWVVAFGGPGTANERTFISALWPASVALPARERLRDELSRRWERMRDETGAFLVAPKWTYFDVAEAHQWLYLDRQDRVWHTLLWFWENQSSPGLYTWWEGVGEPNSFQRWNHVRGWVDPPHVTPHYWTAAEILLLQIDMLVMMDPKDTDRVVIGSGVPEDWVSHEMRVEGLSVQQYGVDWHWSGGTMRVAVTRGASIPEVVLGPRFPPSAQVTVMDRRDTAK
jgi:hypothetical protein